MIFLFSSVTSGGWQTKENCLGRREKASMLLMRFAFLKHEKPRARSRTKDDAPAAADGLRVALISALVHHHQALAILFRKKFTVQADLKKKKKTGRTMSAHAHVDCGKIAEYLGDPKSARVYE